MYAKDEDSVYDFWALQLITLFSTVFILDIRHNQTQSLGAVFLGRLARACTYNTWVVYDLNIILSIYCVRQQFCM
jgi:hypothetical protein